LHHLRGNEKDAAADDGANDDGAGVGQAKFAREFGSLPATNVCVESVLVCGGGQLDPSVEISRMPVLVAAGADRDHAAVADLADVQLELDGRVVDLEML